MELTKKRWIILIASCFINLCIGSMYAWSVFAAPMAKHLSTITGLSLTAGTLAIVFTVTNSVGPITMITGGRINDTFGPKKVIFVGGLLFGGGMILSGFANGLGVLVSGYGVMTGLGIGMVYGCTISNSIKFFPDKRGFVGGITTACYGFSTVIVSPVANILINNFGVTAAFKIIGATFLVIVCGCSFLIDKCPTGFVPEGWTPPVSKGNKLNANDKNWREMLGTPIFYVMMLVFLCGAFYGLMCSSMASPLAQGMIGMSVANAANVVSILALCSTAGRIIAGYLSDKIGRNNTLAVAFVLAVIGLACLYFTGHGEVMKFYAGIIIVGLSFGAFMSILPGFVADQFGTTHNSVNYGIMFIGFAISGYFGPTVMKNVYAADHSYQRAFLIAAILCVIGFALTFVYRYMHKKEINKTYNAKSA